MIDRMLAQKTFDTYVSAYDSSDLRVRAKISHTMRVADYCDVIAKSMKMDREDIDTAWFLGLLHDIGRFEQVKRYGTFYDRDSVDHAELGADILFKEKLIACFPTERLEKGWQRLAETAVRQHNKLVLSSDLDERTVLFCNILRDADKVDIFRVIAEIPFDVRAGTSKNGFSCVMHATDAVMDCVRQHACVPRDAVHTVFDGELAHICMAFELMFEESRRITIRQGYLQQLTEACEADGDDTGKKQMKLVRTELNRAGFEF